MSNGRKNRAKSCIAIAIVLASLVASSLVLTAFADTTIFYPPFTQGTSYWGVYNGGGSGNLTATINTSTSEVHDGDSSSLQLVISEGTSRVVGFYHVYSPTVDWSSYSGISFWLYGSNSGGYIYFVVFDSAHHYYLDIIQDNFGDVWQQFTLNFTTGFSIGTVDLTQIYALEFAFGNPAPSTLYLDQVVLIGAPPASPTPSPISSPTTSPIASPTAPPTSSPTPVPTPKGPIFFPPEPTPITFPSVSPTSVPGKSTPTPGSSINLDVYVVNGTIPVTDGVVTVGASSVSLNSSGIAFFSDLVAARVYHMSVVVNGVTVYDNNVFVVPASGVFTVNLAVKSSPGISWVLLAGLVLIAVVIIIAIILVTFMLRKRTKH